VKSEKVVGEVLMNGGFPWRKVMEDGLGLGLTFFFVFVFFFDNDLDNPLSLLMKESERYSPRRCE